MGILLRVLMPFRRKACLCRQQNLKNIAPIAVREARKNGAVVLFGQHMKQAVIDILFRGFG
jgi:hypothetical protein